MIALIQKRIKQIVVSLFCLGLLPMWMVRVLFKIFKLKDV